MEKRTRLLLGIIIALGLVVRLAAAQSPAFLDEIFQYYACRLDPEHIKNILLNIDPHLPLYYLWVHCWSALSDNMAFLRLPQVLTGTLSIYLAFLVGRRVTDDRLGLSCAAFTALGFAIWINDIQLRCFGMLALAFMWCLYLVLDLAPRDNDSAPQDAALLKPRQGWPLWIAAFFLMANFNYIGTLSAAVLALLASCAPGLGKALRWKILFITALCALPALLWFLAARAHNHTLDTNVSAGSGRYVYAEIAKLPSYLMGTQTFLMNADHNQRLQEQLGEKLLTPRQQEQRPLMRADRPLGILFWFMALAGLVCLSRRKGYHALVLGAAFLIPLLAIAWGGSHTAKLFQPRYLFPVALPFCLLCLYPLCAAYRSQALRYLGLSLLAVVLGLNTCLAVSFPGNSYLHLNSWEKAVKFVKEHATPQSVLGLSIPYTQVGWAYAYDRQHLNADLSQLHIEIQYKEGYQGPPIMPLYPNLDKFPVATQLKTRPLLVVLCQDNAAGESVLPWILANYNVQDSGLTDSCHAWGQLQFMCLTPKAENLPQPAAFKHREDAQ